MSKDTSGPAFPIVIDTGQSVEWPRILTVSVLPTPAPPLMPIDLDAIRKIVREEVRANAALEAAARQALEALENEHRSPRGYGYELSVYEMRETSAAITNLRAALEEKA